MREDDCGGIGRLSNRAYAIIGCCIFGIVALSLTVAAGPAIGPGIVSDSTDGTEPSPEFVGQPTDFATAADVGSVAVAAETENVSEPAANEPVPQPGDEYFEAEHPDGDWISYINPRDEYRSPYLGDGSGKVCVTLLNEAGDPVLGESIPNTTVTIETGESLEWHTQADPFVVEYPLTDHDDEMPLDGDQFGTNESLPQGDGFLDSHCLEWHGLPEDETVEYGPAEVSGDHADDVEVVGWIQQAHEAWDTDVDPIEDAVPYEEVGGFTYETEASHGQAVVVLQLDGVDDADDDESDDASGDDRGDDDRTDRDDSTDDEAGGDDGTNGDDVDGGADADDADEPIPGFVAIAALLGIAIWLVVTLRRR